MDRWELLNKLQYIIDDSGTGILATIGKDGSPHMRWMTPSFIKGRARSFYCLTAPRLAKVLEIESKPEVEWMIQTRALDQIINLKGRINILDNPSVKTEIIEGMGDKLAMFWKTNHEYTEFVVMETVISEATYYLPMKNSKETVIFE